MFKRLLACCLLVPSLAFGAQIDVDGNQCQVELNYDLQVSPQQLVISDKQQTLYHFEDGQLLVDGQKVALTPEQRYQLEQFQQQLLIGSKDLVAIVNSALSLAADVISQVFQELNIDSDTPEQLMASLQQEVAKAVSAEDGSYQLLSQSFDQAGDEIGEAVESQMEQLMSEGIGQLLMSLGESMSNGEGSFEQRMENFASSMENMGERIEQQVELRADNLEVQAEQLCSQWQKLDLQEQRIHDLVPQLQPYELVTAEQNELAFLR
ncbi:DUF2884 family protein [uncultured Ferrimonas sp.]|uniref:DUF2884 family protein n=1 Tax=uncultured Ferrimonas sp. TaxID=432640 RepID=UPI00260B48BE|nr:DUF2884 family protein [uncultured Ferrimonas sp.]